MSITNIAIDGPAASGKGTLAKKLARRLGFAHLDTGLLYRSVGFFVLRDGGKPEEKQQAVEAAMLLSRVLGNTEERQALFNNPILKGDEISVAASKIAGIKDVRDILLDFQRDFARNPGSGYRGAVLDGRDIGTVICPDAPLKFYIDADVVVRARRRLKELQSRGISITYEAVLKDMQDRDRRDASRGTAPMRPADDAIILDTSAMDADAVLEEALRLTEDRLGIPGLTSRTL